jgi:hypothetical protein
VKQTAGNATVQTNEAAPLQRAEAKTQHVGSTSWGGDLSEFDDSIIDPVVDPAAPPESRGGRLRLFGRSDRGLYVRMPDGRLRATGSPNLYVEHFAPPGELLDTSNFEAALNAAIAHANTLERGATVHVPAGFWPMTAQLTIPGRGWAGPAVVLRGAGRHMTQLSWPTSYTGVCVSLDGYQGDATQWASKFFWFGGLIDIAILAGTGDDGRGIGVLMRSCLFTTMQRVTVMGFGFVQNDGIAHGVGIWIDGNRALSGGYVENNQNQTWTDVLVSKCTTGVRTRAGMFSAFGMQLNQCKWADLLFENGNFISLRDGMFQSSGNNGQASVNPYDGNPFYAVRTWGPMLSSRSGTGATSSAAVGGVVTYTNLSNMVAADVGRWMYIPTATDPREAGAFEIVAYVSPSSVRVRKANGAGATGLAWEVHAYEGGDIVELGGLVYHEGVMQAFARLNLAESSTSAWKFSGIFPHNMLWFLENDGNNRVLMRDLPREAPSAGWVKLRNCQLCEISGIDSDPGSQPAMFDLDPFSRQHIRVNGRSVFTEGRTLTEFLAPACVEIFDPGEVSSVTITNGYAQQCTGLLNGSPFAAASSTNRCVWIPNHPRMGGKPALGSRATNGRRFTATLAVPVPVGSYYGLFVIMHLPSGYAAGSGDARGPALESADGSAEWCRITVDAGDSGGSYLGYMKTIESYAAPQLSLASLGSRKTVAMMLVPRLTNDSPGAPVYPSVLIDSPANVYQYAGTARQATAVLNKITLTGMPGQSGNDLDVAYLAVLKRPLTLAEEAAVFRLADPYRIDRSVQLGAARTGAFAVESVADAVYPVDISGANASTTLPAGRSGDRATFVIVSAAGGHTLTVASVTGTLVLSNDYDSATVIHNGTAWFRAR